MTPSHPDGSRDLSVYAEPGYCSFCERTGPVDQLTKVGSSFACPKCLSELEESEESDAA